MNEQRNSEAENKMNSLPEGDSLHFTATIPVIEEQLQIEKRVVETGKVQISKKVNEQETTVTIPLFHEEYAIDRKVINEVVDTPPPAVRYEGDTMVIPVLREVMVVQKRYEIMEEIRVTKKTSHTQETQQVSLKKEEITIERSKLDEQSPSGK